MFNFFKNISKGTAFDKKVRADFGIEMVQWLHEAYDTQVKQGVVPKSVSYADYAPVMLNQLIQDTAKSESKEISEKYYHAEGKPVTKAQENYMDLMIEIVELEKKYPQFFGLMHTTSDMLKDNDAKDVVKGLLTVAVQRDIDSLGIDFNIAKQVHKVLEELADIDGASQETILDERACNYIKLSIAKSINYLSSK